MSNITKESFENELYTKICQRVDGRLGEEQILLKAFKFFDLDNLGICDKYGFIKTLYKLGVNCVDDDNLDIVFGFYDKGTGHIKYSKFSHDFIELKNEKRKFRNFEKKEEEEKIEEKEKNKNLDFECVGDCNSNNDIDVVNNNVDIKNDNKEDNNINIVKPEKTEYKKYNKNNITDAPYGTINQTKEEILKRIEREKFVGFLDSLKNELFFRGIRGVLSLLRTFTLKDTENKGYIKRSVFLDVLRRFRFDCVENGNVDELVLDGFRFKDYDNTVDYKEVINMILGIMNNKRRNIVKKIFNKLDTNHKGYIKVSDIRNLYIPGENSDCRLGKVNEKFKLCEFIDVIEYYFGMLYMSNDRDINEEDINDINNIKVTYDTFLDFYRIFSFLTADDEIFELNAIGEWGLSCLDGDRR